MLLLVNGEDPIITLLVGEEVEI